MEGQGRCLPVIDATNEGYWKAARQNKLAIQRCDQCAYFVHPPRSVCPRCQSEALTFREVSGQGRVYSYSIMHYPGNPGFDKLPYAVLIVELFEQKNLKTVGNLLDSPCDSIEIGAVVTACFERVSDDIVLPQWRLANPP